MDELTGLLIYGFINFFLAAVSGASGIGAGMISVPLLISLGLSPSGAIATSKFSAFGQAIGSSARFYKEKIVSKRQFLIFGGLSVISGFFGAFGLVALKDQQELVENIVGFVMLALGIPFLYFKKSGKQFKLTGKYVKTAGYPLFVVVHSLMSGIGSGIGSLHSLLFMGFFGMKPISAIALQRATLLLSSVIVLAIFIVTGLIDYHFGLIGILSAVAGSYAGAHIAIKKGDEFILNLVALTSAAFALYLLFG